MAYGMVADMSSELIGMADKDGLVPLANVATLLAEAREHSAGRGFDRVMAIPGSTYRDQSTIVIMPSRSPLLHHRVVQSLHGLIAPMNQKRAMMFCIGDEVGIAYNNMIAGILANPDMASWKYVMTVESDNLVPWDAQKRLLETIEVGQYDAVSGIYFTKGEYNMPMAYGDPQKFHMTGELEFMPRDITQCLAAGQVMEVNGIAMGCALWRLDLFRKIPAPWFVTVDDVVDGRPMGFTQDLYFCRRARMAGRRFAVDMRVRVGHLDLVTDEVY